MILSDSTIVKLRELINEDTEYRSGPKLVQFFNQLGFNDVYKQGFPSRWIYTEENLKSINGTPEIDKCIKKLFSPVNFVGRIPDLHKYISDFNEYLAFDGWKVVINGIDIVFTKAEKIDLTIQEPLEEDLFLRQEFIDLPISRLGFEHSLSTVLEQRLEEIRKTHSANAPLSVIFLAGSTLEGILLGFAVKYPKEFNQSVAAPKDAEGKTKRFPDWKLRELVDVASDIGFLGEDVKKFSHALRDFRNYIHPMAQMAARFEPDEHTAKICLQVG